MRQDAVPGKNNAGKGLSPDSDDTMNKGTYAYLDQLAELRVTLRTSRLSRFGPRAELLPIASKTEDAVVRGHCKIGRDLKMDLSMRPV